jgi:hypothetical protein
MATLGELARLIRSKNAGPFELTFDIMFAEPEVYARVRDSGALSREVVAVHYGLSPEEVKFFAAIMPWLSRRRSHTPTSRATCSTATTMAANNMPP